MGPGIGRLEGEPAPERVAKAHLQRVVARDRRVLLHGDVIVAAKREEINVARNPVVDQHVLHVAVTRSIATFRSCQFRRVHHPNADGDLVQSTAACQVPSKRADVAHCQEIVAGEFVLHPQAELLLATPLLSIGKRRHTDWSDGARDDALVAVDAIRRWGQGDGRVALRSLGIRLVAVSYFVVDALAAANDGLARAPRVISKAKARGQGGIGRK